MAIPLRIHPDNPKVFEFRGAPRVLVCATEHYGAVLNRAFRFERYLADAAEKSQTLTRLFILFREQQHALNPYSTCKPESTDYVSPYPRTGPESAIDGLPKYDLDQWNPEFFERLHRFLGLASDYGIVVEVVVLSNTYNDDLWKLNPLNPRNNINGTETIAWPEYVTRRHAGLFERQRALVRKIVEETHRYDNIFYEVCNEPTGALPGLENAPELDEVDAWQTELASVIRETEAPLPHPHLIAGQEAYRHDGYRQGMDRSFDELFVDVVNVHPLPNTTYRGVNYDMGRFMSKDLCLEALQECCLKTWPERKPLNYDEDNAASRFRDREGWLVHRKRAWTTLLSGGHYDYIDFSIVPGIEAGTAESQRGIRTWVKHLSDFIHSMDLKRTAPKVDWLESQPAHALVSVLAVEGEDYALYLADAREYGEAGAGQPVEGRLSFTLPEGRFEAAAFSPETGLYSPYLPLDGGAVEMALPVFEHDLVVRIRRA